MITNNDDFIDLFEERLCEFTGAPFAVAVDRCTNAILLSLKYLEIDNVVIPNHTYPSVPMTCLNYGMTVNFEFQEWVGGYRIGNSPVWDYAVGLTQNMYRQGQIQCLSFQQKKRLAIGKGGAILLNDYNMYETLRRMRMDGRNSRVHISQDNVDDMIIGYHMNMSPDEAARGNLLLNQLPAKAQGSFQDYPAINQWRCFREHPRTYNRD